MQVAVLSSTTGPSLDHGVETVPGAADAERLFGARMDNKRAGSRVEKPALAPRRLPVRSRKNLPTGAKNPVERKRLNSSSSSSDEGKPDKPSSGCLWSRGSKSRHAERKKAFSPSMASVVESTTGSPLDEEGESILDSAEGQYRLWELPATVEGDDVYRVKGALDAEGTGHKVTMVMPASRAPLGTGEDKVVAEESARTADAVEGLPLASLPGVNSSTQQTGADDSVLRVGRITSANFLSTAGDPALSFPGDPGSAVEHPEQWTARAGLPRTHPEFEADTGPTESSPGNGDFSESLADLGAVARVTPPLSVANFGEGDSPLDEATRLVGDVLHRFPVEDSVLVDERQGETADESFVHWDLDGTPFHAEDVQEIEEIFQVPVSAPTPALAGGVEHYVQNDPDDDCVFLLEPSERTGQGLPSPGGAWASSRADEPEQQSLSGARQFSQTGGGFVEPSLLGEQIPPLPEPAGSGMWPTPAELRERRSRKPRKRHGVRAEQPREPVSVPLENPSRSGMAEYILRQAVEEESRMARDYDEQGVQFLFGLAWLGEVGEQRRKRQRRRNELQATNLTVDLMSLENMLKEIKRRLRMYEARNYLSRDTPFFKMYSYLKECTQRLRLTQQQIAKQSYRRRATGRSDENLRSDQEEGDGASAVLVNYDDTEEVTDAAAIGADVEVSDLSRALKPQSARGADAAGLQREEPGGQQRLSEPSPSLGYDEATETAQELRFFLTKLKADLQVYVAEGQICQLMHGDCPQAAMDKEVNTPAAREEIRTAYNGLIAKTLQSLQMAAEAIATRRRRLKEISNKTGVPVELASSSALQDYISLLEALEATYGYQQKVVRNKQEMGPAFFPAGMQSPPQLLPGKVPAQKHKERPESSMNSKKARVAPAESDVWISSSDEEQGDANGDTDLFLDLLPVRKRRHHSADALMASGWEAEEAAAGTYRPRAGSHGGHVSAFSDAKWQELNALVAHDYYRNCRLTQLQVAATVSAVRHFQAVASHLKGHVVNQSQLFFPFLGPEHMFFEEDSVSFKLDKLADTGTPSFGDGPGGRELGGAESRDIDQAV